MLASYRTYCAATFANLNHLIQTSIELQNVPIFGNLNELVDNRGFKYQNPDQLHFS